MNKSRFRIEKTTYYSFGKKESEEFTIYGYSDKMLCSGERESIEELYQQLTLALNDHKETKNERTTE
nr:MAG TPA: hypothetical protein [Caudoviricetes sp.]